MTEREVVDDGKADRGTDFPLGTFTFTGPIDATFSAMWSWSFMERSRADAPRVAHFLGSAWKTYGSGYSVGEHDYAYRFFERSDGMRLVRFYRVNLATGATSTEPERTDAYVLEPSGGRPDAVLKKCNVQLFDWTETEPCTAETGKWYRFAKDAKNWCEEDAHCALQGGENQACMLPFGCLTVCESDRDCPAEETCHLWPHIDFPSYCMTSDLRTMLGVE